MTLAELLDALHLWLHRSEGDEDLAAACDAHVERERFNAFTLGSGRAAIDALPPEQREALVTLERYYLGERVDLIGACEAFHESFSDAECAAMNGRVRELDGVCHWSDD